MVVITEVFEKLFGLSRGGFTTIISKSDYSQLFSATADKICSFRLLVFTAPV